MNIHEQKLQHQTRRHFLADSGICVGGIALGQLLSDSASGADLVPPPNPLLPKKPHFDAKAKRVIYIHLTGSPPHLDLWDYKPELVKRNKLRPNTNLEQSLQLGLSSRSIEN